ncbi:ion transporter [Maritimibacter sp. UBA3975]|uniref:ion transporter n=1 Tax=Maritimibacter sp. UBA3975 TaxID=1946833 RepID=UPI000C0B5568|nr:ion transporter [Maritimibacter sp. UBA3975]MAM63115.1 voltage-gated potassium channel [Maritimibacter sp.]
MSRAEILQILDGTHPTVGRSVALAMDLLVLASALAIAVETVPGLDPTLRRALFSFEVLVVLIFATEYFLRLFSARKPARYVFSFWGVVDLMAWLPAVLMFIPAFQAVRVLRLIRLLRLIKLFNTAPALNRLMQAFGRVKSELVVWGVISTLLLYISAVGIYVFENPVQPEVFSSIPAALWWSVVSFTTVGYGDMFPITPMGRLLTTVLLFIGLGIFAVPAAIVTTALLEAETKLDPRDPEPKTPESNKGD